VYPAGPDPIINTFVCLVGLSLIQSYIRINDEIKRHIINPGNAWHD
jgi:hypothetical protein